MQLSFGKKPLWKKLGKNIQLVDPENEQIASMCKHFLLMLKVIEKEHPNRSFIWDPLLFSDYGAGLTGKGKIPVMGVVVFKIQAETISWNTSYRLAISNHPDPQQDPRFEGATIIIVDLVKGEIIKPGDDYPDDCEDYFLLDTAGISINKNSLKSTKLHAKRGFIFDIPPWLRDEHTREFARR